MYKLCKTEQSASRQHDLEAGLLAAMGTKSFEEISVSELCDQLGIPRKSFYRYFSSKDGALQALIDHTLMEFESFSIPYQKSGKRTLHRDMECFFQFWIHHQPLLDALRRSNFSGMLIERAITYALTDSALPRRFLPQDGRQIQEQVTMFAVCGLMSMVLAWYQDGYRQSVTQMAQIAVRLLSKPLFPDAGMLI